LWVVDRVGSVADLDVMNDGDDKPEIDDGEIEFDVGAEEVVVDRLSSFVRLPFVRGIIG